MRPLKLTMQAFGPYAAKTDIDFDSLGNTGVYLVCGDTGSGKTMIFDALCYALFGQTSGSEKDGARTTTSLRSDYATEAEKTFAELVFEYRGERYRVKRNPEYRRAKKRGEGTTKQRADAELEFPDGRVVSGPSKVDCAIEELLGIDVDQFKQIVMLAQGEFRRLLTADTDSRERIFRNLFGTELYARIQKKLGDDAARLENRHMQAKSRIAGIAESAAFPEASDLAEELASKISAKEPVGTWLFDVLGEQLREDEPLWKELDDKVMGLRTEYSEARAALELAKSKVFQESKRKEVVAEIARLEKDAPSLAKALEEKRALEKKRQDIENEAARIEGSFSKYDELELAQNAREQARKQSLEAKRTLGECEAAYREAAENAEKLGNRVEQLQGSDVIAARKQAEFEASSAARDEASNALKAAQDLQERGRAANLLAEKRESAENALDAAKLSATKAEQDMLDAREALEAYGNIEAEIATAKASLESQTAKAEALDALSQRREKLGEEVAWAKQAHVASCEELKAGEARHAQNLEHFNSLQKRQRAGRAGLLAADLQDGFACPVCGSTDHPNPADANNEIPTDAELDEAAKMMETSQVQVSEQAARAEQLKAMLAQKNELLAEFEEEHGGEEELRSALKEARSKLGSFAEAVRALEAKASEAERAKHALASAERSGALAGKALDDASEACRMAREEHIAAQKTIAALREALGVVDVDVARERYEQANDACETLRRESQAALQRAKELAHKRHEHAHAKTQVEQAENKKNQALALSRKAAEEESIAEHAYAHLSKDLRFEDKGQAVKHAAQLRESAAQMKRELDAALSGLQSNETALSTNRELLKSIDENLGSLSVDDPRKVEKRMDELQQQGTRTAREASVLRSRIDANKKCLERLDAALKEVGLLEEQYASVSTIAKVASGNYVGAAKIRFEAYVQAIYFDRVIDAANRRLAMLANGQFKLVRYSEGAGNSKAGLDLYVIDSFTGRVRDASSLSGGESFQASLCLALGLSDIVQAHAGGIEFDTMFVDEGFGSLDQGSLGNAISLLSDLSSGTKLVGIISHVEDLKASIPKKVIVTKGRSGSSVALEL